ncbi:hypothetical protein HYDPIDRAFT_28079 [Hydnomerulius pinastri MD-312]|uniref:WD40 repeat-like protein n=1 Tax=Hydnomerulius pinastri MD-312 TaxID=994086 RepID=A0A0C9WG30_9AGAM|nr:hypothetical protein HYDPIDRAFT_28079 [Hydnomerulius pinastri MD-312]
MLHPSPRPAVPALADMSTYASSMDTSSSSNSVDSKRESRPVPIQTFEGHENWVTCVAFFKDEQRLVTGSDDKTVRVWNREMGAQIGDALQAHTSIVYAVDVSGDGRTIASSSMDQTVRIWDAETEELLHTLFGHQDMVGSVHISPDSKRVASGSDDGTLRVWDIENGDLAFNFKPIKCNGQVDCVRYSPSGDRIASAANSIQIWNADTADHILSIELQGGAVSLAWSLNGEQLIGGGCGNIIIFDTSSGQQIRTWKAHDSWITSFSLSPNGIHLATCSTDEKTAFVFDITTGEQIAAYEHVKGLAYSPSGRFIGAACLDKNAYLWDAPGDPRSTSQRSPGSAFLDLPAVAPQGEPPQDLEQQGCDYADFFDRSATVRSPDRVISRHQSASLTPRRHLSRLQDAISNGVNRRRKSRAGGEETSTGPSWWKRSIVALTPVPQPAVVNDQHSLQHASAGMSDRTQIPPENNNPASGSNRWRNGTTQPQPVQVAAGRDKAFWGIIHDIEYDTTNTILFMFCYCRRPPVDDAAEDEPAPDSEDLRPGTSNTAPNPPGGSRVVGAFNRLLVFLHIRKPQNVDVIELQPPTTTVVVPPTSIPPQLLSRNVASVGPCDLSAAQPGPPVVVVSPPVDPSNALSLPSLSDSSPMSLLASLSQPSSSQAPPMPSSPGFSSGSPTPDSCPSSSQIDDFSPFYALSPDEVALVQQHRQQRGGPAVAPGAHNEPPHSSDSIVSQCCSTPPPVAPLPAQLPTSSSSVSPTTPTQEMSTSLPSAHVESGLDSDSEPGWPQSRRVNSERVAQAFKDALFRLPEENPWDDE